MTEGRVKNGKCEPPFKLMFDEGYGSTCGFFD